MTVTAENTEDYISKIPAERKEAMKALIDTIRKKYPGRF